VNYNIFLLIVYYRYLYLRVEGINYERVVTGSTAKQQKPPPGMTLKIMAQTPTELDVQITIVVVGVRN